MKKFFLSMASALIAVSAMADSYTLTFKTNGESDSGTKYSTNVEDVLSAGSEYVSEVSNNGKVYPGRDGRGAKFGSSSVAGNLTFTLSEAGTVKATSIVIKGGAYISSNSAENAVLTVNGIEVAFDQTVTTYTPAEYTYTFDAPTEISTISLVQKNDNKGRLYISDVIVNYNAAGAVEDGTYYIQNVESGLFMAGNNAWGTQASAVTTGDEFAVALTEGGYTITGVSLTSGNKTLGYNLYVDTNTAQNGNLWTIAPVAGEKGVYTLHGKGKKDNVEDNFDGYVAQSATAGEVTGYILEGVAEVTAAAKWRFVTKEELIANIDVDDNVTFLLSNPSFTRNHSVEAWVIDAGCTHKNLTGGANNNTCAESYHSVFNIHQTVMNVPNGTYLLTAQGFYRQDGSDNEHLPVFYANGKTTTFPLKTGSENSMADASNSFTQGLYTIEPLKFEVTDGTITLGVKNENSTVWCIWDNFQLQYKGEDLEAAAAQLLADYNENINKRMNEGVQTLAIAAYNTFLENPTKDNLNALSTAIANMKQSVADYAAFQTALDATTAKVATLTASGQEVYATLAADLITSFNDCQMEGNKSADLEAFFLQAVKAQTEIGAEFVYLAPANTQANWVGANGMLAPNWANATPYTFAERYNVGAIAAGDVMTQTLYGLAPGYYEVTLAAAANYTSGRGFECQTGDGLSVVFANEGEVNLPVVERSSLTADAEVLYTVNATVKAADAASGATVLTYGIKNLAEAGNWYAVTVVSIKSAEAPEPELVSKNLAPSMFLHWTAPVDGEVASTTGCEYVLNESTGLPYGDGNVNYLNYADLSGCYKLEITVSEGAPRCCFNREKGATDEFQGTVLVETPRDAEYQTVDGNVYTIDIKKIVEKYGYAHLNCIKGANWANVTVTSMVLYAENEECFPASVFPAMTISYDAETNLVTFTPADANAYYYASLGSVAALEGIDVDTYTSEILSDYNSMSEILADGALVKGVQSIDITGYITQFGYGEWVAFSNFVDASLTISETTKYSFTVTEKEPELVETDLTAGMFYIWTAPVDGEVVGNGYASYVLNESTGLPYGDGNVNYLNYADLSGCYKLEITVSEGAPRCCFNREKGATDEFQGTVLVETPRDAEYQTVDGNVYTIDIKKIVEKYGYAHLNCIKGANWANVTVNSMKLYAVSAENFPTAIEAISVENNETIIDLQGRKVSEMKAGQIYLVGGKKVVK